MSSTSGVLRTWATDSAAATASIAANQPQVARDAAGEKDQASRHGTPKTNAATAPKAGETTTPRATPPTSATTATSAPSARSSAASAGERMPRSAYSPNSRERRRMTKRLAYAARTAKTSTTKTENAPVTSRALCRTASWSAVSGIASR